MAETLKDMLLDKAVEALLELLIDSSKEEVQTLLERNKLQKILHKAMLDFSQGAYFNREFSGVIFVDESELVYSIPDDAINPAFTTDQIESALNEVIEVCFVTDNPDVLKPIARNIAMLYLQRAKMTIQLHNVLQVQREGFDTIASSVSDLKEVYLENTRYELQLKREKEVLLKKELHNEVSSVISEMMKLYLALVMKEMPSFSGDEMNHLDAAMANKTQSTIDRIAEYIHEDFCRKPVSLLIVNGLESKTITLPYFVFAETSFRKTILFNTEKLLMYRDIIDIETYVNILRLRNSVQSVLFPPLIEMGQTNVLQAANETTIDPTFAQKELADIGGHILAIYRNLVQ